MKHFLFSIFLASGLLLVSLYIVAPSMAYNSTDCNGLASVASCDSISTEDLGFKIPSLGDILTFVIRAFFVIAGLAALLYMLIGAFSWVTSGGDSDAVSAARNKIQAAVVGMLIIVAVLALVWTMEQVIFQRRICLGLSCPVTMPGLIEADDTARYCCKCPKDDGSFGELINAYKMKCTGDGIGAQR